MRMYSASRAAVGAQVFTLQSGAAPALARLVEFRRGMHSTNTTQTRNRATFQRTTVGTTPTNATEDKLSSRSPAPAGNVVTAWVTPPTVAGNPLLILSNGTRQRDPSCQTWRPPRPWATPILFDTEQADVREADTGGAPAFTIAFSESPAHADAGRRFVRRPRRGNLVMFSSSETRGAQTTAFRTQHMRECWAALVSIPRPARGVQNWISFYGAAVAPPSDRPYTTTVLVSPFPYYVEV